jgi:hypothetical protein
VALRLFAKTSHPKEKIEQNQSHGPMHLPWLESGTSAASNQPKYWVVKPLLRVCQSEQTVALISGDKVFGDTGTATSILPKLLY